MINLLEISLALNDRTKPLCFDIEIIDVFSGDSISTPSTVVLCQVLVH